MCRGNRLKKSVSPSHNAIVGKQGTVHFRMRRPIGGRGRNPKEFAARL